MSLDFFSRKRNFTSFRTSLSAIRKFINKVSSNEFTNVSNVSQAFFKIVGFTGKRFFFLSSLLRFFFFFLSQFPNFTQRKTPKTQWKRLLRRLIYFTNSWLKNTLYHNWNNKSHVFPRTTNLLLNSLLVLPLGESAVISLS